MYTVKTALDEKNINFCDDAWKLNFVINKKLTEKGSVDRISLDRKFVLAVDRNFFFH
jgi:hypothetical protein